MYLLGHKHGGLIMYEFIEGSLMLQFMAVFSTIFIVFAFLICWFMEFELEKALNFHSKREKAAREELAVIEKANSTLLEFNCDLGNKVTELKEIHEKEKGECKSNYNKLREEGHMACIKHREDVDNIAETLGIRVKLKGWIGKTDTLKMATILKKIQKR